MTAVRSIAAFLAVPLAWAAFNLIGPRFAYTHLAVAALVTIALAYWRRWSPVWPALALLGLAGLLLLSSVDVVLEEAGRCAIALKPVAYGLGCDDRQYACYGCTVMANGPRYALVISH